VQRNGRSVRCAGVTHEIVRVVEGWVVEEECEAAAGQRLDGSLRQVSPRGEVEIVVVVVVKEARWERLLLKVSSGEAWGAVVVHELAAGGHRAAQVPAMLISRVVTDGASSSVVDGEHDAIPREGGVGVAAERLWRVSHGEEARDPAIAEVYVSVDTNVQVDVAGAACVGASRLDKLDRVGSKAANTV
jgi:hypothetical protein